MLVAMTSAAAIRTPKARRPVSVRKRSAIARHTFAKIVVTASSSPT